MKYKLRPYKLIGGTNDGRIVEAPSWQTSVYMHKRLSFAEMQELRIDDNIAWKQPEEVYERERNDDCYKYVKTVHYHCKNAKGEFIE